MRTEPSGLVALPTERSAHADVAALVGQARATFRDWSGVRLDRRLGVLRNWRHALAENAEQVVAEVASPLHVTRAQATAAELLPLLDAVRYLELESGRILAPRRLGRWGGPLWLGALSTEVRREPLGLVLIVAPSNYPLFLPGVQLAQALAAGNTVLLKPGAGTRRGSLRLQSMLRHAGLPDGVLQVLDENPNSVGEALRVGVDRVVITGSAASGAAVMEAAARAATPVTAELSGSDPMIVLPGADLERVGRAATFAATLNSGRTCIATRWILASRPILDALVGPLIARLSQHSLAIDPRAREALASALLEARASGARRLWPLDDRETGPFLLDGVLPHLRVVRDDLGAPLISLVEISDVDDAVRTVNAGPFALGASVFGSGSDVTKVVDGLECGSVTVNDVIVPTADPRVPFSGRRASRFGVTRGPEGLLELTYPKVVSRRGRGPTRHLDGHFRSDGPLLIALAKLLHGRGAARWRASREFLSAARRARAERSQDGSP